MNTEILKTARSSAAFARLYLDKFGSTPDKKKTLLENTGTTLDALSSKDAFFSAFSMRHLMKNISISEGENWIFRYHSLWRLEAAGNFTTLVKNCPTIGEAIKSIMEFGPLLEHTQYFEQFDSTKNRHILFGIILPFAETQRTHLELIGLNVYLLLEQLLDELPADMEIWFNFERPAYAALYKNVFKCRVKFGQKYCALTLPLHVCDLPLPQADSRRFAQSLKMLRQAKDDITLAPKRDDALVDSVKKHLSAFISERPGVDETAQALGLSRRSLTRKLTQSGFSHREILDNISKDLATKLLAEGRYTREEIAEKLGYKDPTSFSRSLKRWRNSK